MSATLELRRILADVGQDCERCALKGNGKLVFGSGPPNAKIFLVGEGPGREEAEKGTPFVGPAGKQLNELLARAGISRGECYVGNVVKHQPPGWRQPTQEEVKACLPFLKQQIRAVNPKVIVLLGSSATLAFLGITIRNCLGGMFEFEGAWVVPTFHPSYVLQQPHAWVQVVADFQRAKRLAK